MNVMELQERIARSLRAERARTGLSLSETARRAGVSKATLSQLESGAGNPSVETLWALADALGVPFSRLVEDQPGSPVTLLRLRDLPAVPAAAAPYAAALVSACPPGARRDLYLIRAEPGEGHHSAPHPSGTVEHVVLCQGRAEAGPATCPEALEPGEYLRYPGDAEHVFVALAPGTVAVLVSELR